MDNAALQLRKVKLEQQKACLRFKTDQHGNPIMYHHHGPITINLACDHKAYKVAPGEFFLSQISGELFLFLGLGPATSNTSEANPWILRETEYQLSTLTDNYLIEQFDECYVKI